MKILSRYFTIFTLVFLTNQAIGQKNPDLSKTPNNAPAQVYLMGQEREYTTNQGEFYDDGGKDGDISNQYKIITFKAKSGKLEMFFPEFNIPYGAELRVYNGLSNHDQLIRVYKSGDKIANIIGEYITFEYLPSEYVTNLNTYGWKGIIQPASTEIKSTNTMPESDCQYAIPLCANNTVVALGGLYTDLGNVNDDGGTCYSGTGSGGSVWYSFSPQATGPLDFRITPTGSTDYDFVVWDITAGCGNGQRVEKSCNFSLYTGITGLSSTLCSEAIGGGSNCTSNDCSTDSKQSDCNRFNRRINVTVGRQYAICINFYSGSNDGFTLAFQLEPSSVPITDVTPPVIVNAYANNCNSATTLHIHFSEWIDCTTLQNTDFTLAGYTFTITNDYCNNGRSNQVDLSVSPALAAGTYSLNATGIMDLCGNNMNSNFNIVLGTPPSPNAGTDKITCKSPGPFGIGWSYSPSSQTLTASGGTYYEWSDGQIGSSVSVSPSSTTTYTVTVSQGACVGTDIVVVNVEQSPQPNLGSNQAICPGFSVVLNAGTTGASYQWQSTTTTLFGTPVGWSNIGGATSQTYTASPGSTTYYQVIVTSPNGCQGSDWMEVSIGGTFSGAIASPATICTGGSSTLSVPSGITSYVWTGGPTNASWTVTPASTTTYTVSSSTAGCTGSTTVAVYVNSIPTVTALCSGTTPVNLTATPSAATSTITENFEGATQTLTLINGSDNKWYHGTATACTGTKSLFIGTNSTTYSYVNWYLISGVAACNFAYIDVPITGYCNADLSFNWKCLGKSTDNLTVWAIPNTTTPVAGTPLTATGGNVLLGGPYWNNGAACTPVTLSLLPGVGTTKRIVFQWQNIAAPLFSNTAAPPPASIDDIVITQNTSFGYSWTSSPAGFTSTQQNPIANPSVPTSYTCVVTRCDGCVNSATTSACGPASALPVADFSVSDSTICAGSCVNFTDLTTNSPTSWSWAFTGGTPATSTSQNPNVCYNTAGTYAVSLTATNSGGSDIETKSGFITVVALPSVSVNPLAPTICPGSSETLTASGATTYTWAPSTGLNTTSGATVIANPAVTTTYTVTGTTSGCTGTTTVVVTVSPGLSVSVSPNPATICAGASETLTASGATTYAWSPSTGLSSTSGTTVVANPASTITYTITGTTAGCTGTATTVVNVNPIPTVSVTPNPVTLCNGESATLTASGASSYSWSPGTGLSATTGATVVANPSSAITYTVSGTDLGCTGTTTVTVNVTAAIIADAGNDTTICEGGSANLLATGGSVYAWSPATGLSCTNCQNPVATPTITTTYTVTVSSGSCTPATDDVIVTVNPTPTVTVTPNPLTLCSGTSGTLTASGATTYAWSPSTGLNTTSGSTVITTPATSITYTVTGTTGSCSATASVPVTVSSSLVITVNNPTICSGSSATLTASGGTTYAWNTGATTNPITINPTTTTTYTVTGTSSGCTGTATSVVTVNQVPVPTITGDTLICSGSSTILTAAGGTTYVWSTSATTASITVNPLTVTTYTVTVSNGPCSATEDITVSTLPNPTANAGNDTTITLGASAQLNGSGGVTYAWSPATGLSCTDCANPIATPSVTTTYTLVVTGANGCTNADIVIVSVEIQCGEVFIPNAFSPNNDGQNDLECVFGNCITEIRFAIFDRWGEKVFETTDPKVACWDGKYKGEFMNSGVFVYYMKATLLTGEEIERQGNITLFR
ncbi:MAG: gliding motility-associated C-terminal domain-containing protein [Bacteroidota bacterium]